LPSKEISVDHLVCQAFESAPPEVQDRMVARLVAKVYETAPPTLQIRLLHQLIQPLGILSLLSIADGIFAKVWFQNTWPDMKTQFEDAQNVRANDVVSLVEFVQRVSADAVDGLAHLLSASPVITSSAAVVLVSLLMSRSFRRQDSDHNFSV
jgi:hypothetical protein